MGGATVQWLRDGLGIIGEASDIEALAREVDDSDGVGLESFRRHQASPRVAYPCQ